MEPSDSSSSAERPGGGAFVVRDPEQARLLSDPRGLRYFEPFLARTRSVSQAADEVGCALDTMYYRVRTFVDAGLLEVVEERPRAGRPIKLYRSVADEFVIPFEVTPFAELEDRLRTLNRQHEDLIARTMARLLREGGMEGRRLYRGADGDVNAESAGEGMPRVDWDRPETLVYPGRALAENLSVELDLSDDEARALLLELYRLLLRGPGVKHAAAPPGGGREPYLVRFTLLPLRGAERD